MKNNCNLCDQVRYKIGDIVYLVTDPEQKERIVTMILISPGAVRYYINNETVESLHYRFELSPEKDVLKSL